MKVEACAPLGVMALWVSGQAEATIINYTHSLLDMLAVTETGEVRVTECTCLLFPS